MKLIRASLKRRKRIWECKGASLISSFQRRIILCAYWVGGANTCRFASRHSLKTTEWRVPFVFESRHFLFLKRKPPLAFAAHSFFQIPPAKNQNGEERQGERARRAVLHAWRGSEGRHAIGAYLAGSSHHARGACEVGSRRV